MELRLYQQEFVDEVFRGVEQYQRVIAVAPTGAGKGFMMGFIVEHYIKQGKRVLILSARTEILKQNLKYVANFGNEADFINPKQRDIPTAQVTVAMAQTMRRRVEKAEWVTWVHGIDMLIIDEAHEQASDFIHDYIRTDCEVIGLTATPRRYAKMKQLGSMYRAIVSTINVKTLVEMGYLAKPTLYSIAAPKLDDVPVDSNGDYRQTVLARRFDDRVLYSGLVSEFKRLVPDKKTIVFCVSSKQAIGVTEEFNANGISARYVLSGSFDSDATYSGERSEVFRQFKDGEFQVLVNVGVAVSGLDIPDIECVVTNFATVSICKWKQCLGRAARTTPTKREFVIIDCGANYKRLGRYEDDIPLCLWHDTNPCGDSMVLKQCPEDKPDINGKRGCGEFVPVSCKVCPSCGRIFVTEKHEAVMRLEEIADGDRQNDIIAWAADKYVHEHWKLPRIMIQVCLANPNNERRAFKAVYRGLFPGKTDQDANKYYFMFCKQFGHIFGKKS